MAVTFLAIESKSDSPIMPLEIYGNRAVAVSVMVTILTGFGLHSTALLTLLYLLGALRSALVGGLGDAFTLSALVVGLSFLAALFLRVEKRRG